ncbi:unnamed protein product [Mycena citricolor]|uniref:Uncharacterized protein n=1 Tax=Mycena citricolor TaxID=2018698 RepID=A0AAD2HFF0_9AGAR|nr:unnamed protein product [Mycena citricolor]
MDCSTSPQNGSTAEDPAAGKISAYYSLVFPTVTFYVRTLSVTIGRRCSPSSGSSSAPDGPQVDVDLGALKSVSRLHAKIEYDQEEDRFVLIVVGRNGAWVDGVWSARGSRTPLGERSQIQIASRTFHFVLPPPPPPEDSPSPSSRSSTNRPLSPSVDIDVASLSPPSSPQSRSPPPVNAKPLTPLRDPQISASKSPGSKVNTKKRKKLELSSPPLPPKPKLPPGEVPEKPALTLRQLILLAIKGLDGKGTLQEICNWIMKAYEHYQHVDDKWMSSVRHTLSSDKHFTKLERSTQGKGFFWTINEAVEEQTIARETRADKAAADVAFFSPLGGKRPTWSAKAIPSVLPSAPETAQAKRPTWSAKAIPPVPISAPAPVEDKRPTWAAKSIPSATTSVPISLSLARPHVVATPKPALSMNPLPHGLYTYTAPKPTAKPPYPALTQSRVNLLTTTTPKPAIPVVPAAPIRAVPIPTLPAKPTTGTHKPASTPPAHMTASPASTSADVSVPIILGPIPATHPDYSPSHPNNSVKEGYMVLHERTLILDPTVFNGLGTDTLKELEKLGARKALAVLAGHMVRVLKERRALAARGRPRGRGRPKPGMPGRSAIVPLAAVGVPETTGLGLADSPLIIVDDSDGESQPAPKRQKTEVA